jgi:predicted dehydrogenase
MFRDGVMNRSTIRVGVVGCGLIAQVMHLPHLRELDDRFEVAALCDIAPGPLEFAGRLFPDARRHTDWTALLDERLDAVLVLTTAGGHAPVAVAAAGAGVHVFVEKPMCLNVAEGEEMAAAAEAAGVVLMVGYMKRYDPAYEELARTLDRGAVRFARITTLESPIEPYALHHPRPAPGPSVAAASADGFVAHAYRSILLDSMVHELNGVRGLLGEPDVLHWARIWGSPSGVTAALTFGEIEAVFMWVDLPGIARYRQDWAFYGPRERATLGFPSPLLRNEPTELVLEGGDDSGVASWRTERTVSYEEAFKRELVAFADAIRDGRAPLTDGRDALRDIALCQAIVHAHTDGSSVARPAEPRAPVP